MTDETREKLLMMADTVEEWWRELLIIRTATETARLLDKMCEQMIVLERQLRKLAEEK